MKQIFLILTILIFLTSCGGDDTPEVEQQPESPIAQAASPLSDSPIEPTPTTVTVEAAKRDIPATVGVVEGTIIADLKAGPKPLSTIIIALAEVIIDDQGIPKVAGYSASSAPRAITDEQGHFVIENAPPGTYGLILDSVISSYLLADPTSGDSILLEVKGGEVTDLGTLEYANLPVDGYTE